MEQRTDRVSLASVLAMARQITVEEVICTANIFQNGSEDEGEPENASESEEEREDEQELREDVPQ